MQVARTLEIDPTIIGPEKMSKNTNISFRMHGKAFAGPKNYL